MQRTARTCSQGRAARAARLFFLIRPIKFLIFDVAAVDVVDAKAAYCYKYSSTFPWVKGTMLLSFGHALSIIIIMEDIQRTIFHKYDYEPSGLGNYTIYDVYAKK